MIKSQSFPPQIVNDFAYFKEGKKKKPQLYDIMTCNVFHCLGIS